MPEKQIFDYAAAIAELETIAARVEDPSTGIDDIDRSIRRAQQLVGACRRYLRSTRDNLSALEK